MGNFKSRWMTLKDVPVVLRLEMMCKDKEDYLDERAFEWYCEGWKQGIILATNDKGSLVGYVAFLSREKDNQVTHIAVHPRYRRTGVGSYLLMRVTQLQGTATRDYNVSMVRECDLQSQLFFKANGFNCQEVIDDAFQMPTENGYYFLWTRPGTNEL